MNRLQVTTKKKFVVLPRLRLGRMLQGVSGFTFDESDPGMNEKFLGNYAFRVVFALVTLAFLSDRKVP